MPQHSPLQVPQEVDLGELTAECCEQVDSNAVREGCVDGGPEDKGMNWVRVRGQDTLTV